MEQLERKLVTIRKISNITSHPNADKLEIAHIDGWKVIVGKGEFKINESVVYFEIDSLIPVTPEFEFLRKYCFIKKDWLAGIMSNNEAFRIKSLKLRGELSQGLIIPISDSLMHDLALGWVFESDDLSNYFKVVKYDPPVKASGTQNVGRISNFPSFIPKTKEERIQNISQKVITEAFENRELFESTRKYHGMSITVYAELDNNVSFFEWIFNGIKKFLFIDVQPKYKVGVCSHNVELDVNNLDNQFVKAAVNSNLINACVQLSRELGTELAIQGELCGPGIQKNHHGLKNDTIFVFNIYDIKNQRYIEPVGRQDMVRKLIHNYGFAGEHAVSEFTNKPLVTDDIDVLLSISSYLLASGNQNEGIVYKSLERDFSFKVVSNDFLLAEK